MSEPDSDSDRSVTSLAEASVVRERAPDIKAGDVLAGRYQIEAIIGKGGSGIVLRAFDRTAQMLVALKVLRPELAADQRWAHRFARELRLGRPIRHPNVCRIFDIGEADGHMFLTMELAAGGTLRDLIKTNAPLRPLPERLADAQAAIAGLGAIHEAGIVHRDVKPDNMLRMADGRLALSDFGLATDSRTPVRSPSWLARLATWRPRSVSASRPRPAPMFGRWASSFTRFSSASARSRSRPGAKRACRNRRLR